MKIGILTLHYGANYGGVLQCYALQEVLKLRGHDVEVINFIPRARTSIWKKVLYNCTTARSLFGLFGLLSHRLKKRVVHAPYINPNLVRIFDEFRLNYISLSPCVDENTIKNLICNYEAIVVGSDQVWGQFVRDKLTYLGDWGTVYKGKLIAYAACAISLNYPFVRRKKLSRLLKRFDRISVRDTLTQQLVYELLGEKVDIVLDPTMLFDFSRFVAQRIIVEPYILIYVLGEEIKGGNEEALKRIKHQIGNKEVVAVSIYDENIRYADVTMKNVSPQNWVNMFAYADFVYTDSFHGILFSLKYHRSFVAYYREKNRASRLLDIKERWNLDMIVDDINNIQIENVKEREEFMINDGHVFDDLL